MRLMMLVLLLSFGTSSFAKTSTDLLLCGALELGDALLNGVTSIYSDSMHFNQTDVSFELDKTLKTSTVTYGVSAGLMTLAGVVSMFDSRIDYEGSRTNRIAPGAITGFIAAAVLSSTIGMITSGISFGAILDSNLLGLSLGSVTANWIALIGALRWVYYMKILQPSVTSHAPDTV
jgi:hypothetical protein